MKPLIVHPVATRIFRRGESLKDFLIESVPAPLVREGIVVAVTSKIVSLAEGRLVPHDSVAKRELVEREADTFLGEIGHGCFLTIKDGLLIASAGIDESNSQNGDYILYPEDPFSSAEKLWSELRQAWGVKDLGILFTDSHTTPLRRGVTGVCLSYAGFRAIRNMVGSRDLFGRQLKMTQMNFADGLAAATVMMMGEGAEGQPVAVVENPPVQFCEKIDRSEFQIPLQEDLYYPLLRSFISRA